MQRTPRARGVRGAHAPAPSARRSSSPARRSGCPSHRLRVWGARVSAAQSAAPHLGCQGALRPMIWSDMVLKRDCICSIRFCTYGRDRTAVCVALRPLSPTGGRSRAHKEGEILRQLIGARPAPGRRFEPGLVSALAVRHQTGQRRSRRIRESQERRTPGVFFFCIGADLMPG